MEPISNFGRIGKYLILLVGIGLMIWGGVSAIHYRMPDYSAKCDAVITDFVIVPDNDLKDQVKYNDTLVSYSIDGKAYTRISLGQYEASWVIGDKIKIIYNRNDPVMIQTFTRTFSGIIIFLAGIPFVVISLFSIISIRRRAAKTPEEIAEDEERTTAGKLKYKVTSIVYPLSAGIPITAIGIIFYLMENNYILSLLFCVLGIISTLVALRSIIYYFIIKYRNHKEDKKSADSTAE